MNIQFLKIFLNWSENEIEKALEICIYNLFKSMKSLIHESISIFLPVYQKRKRLFEINHNNFLVMRTIECSPKLNEDSVLLSVSSGFSCSSTRNEIRMKNIAVWGMKMKCLFSFLQRLLFYIFRSLLIRNCLTWDKLGWSGIERTNDFGALGFDLSYFRIFILKYLDLYCTLKV